MTSLRGQMRWKSMGDKPGAYDGRDKASNFKSCICFMVRMAAWGRTLSCCRHAPYDNKPRRFLQIADKLVPKHTTVTFTVHEHKDITDCSILRILYNCAGVHLHNLCTIHNQISESSSDWDWVNCFSYQFYSRPRTAWPPKHCILHLNCSTTKS
jgi:hypothetical protein